ncbi:hypothetical protein TRSC58_06251 [Trypanosoma rangeli SC58]|uniref:PH-like domain-containing protein n=1 Tax=Trypanosoma rangeli SC58 TaxID=429131 RepID=A0A061IVJ8_TRYRA|nr:hypothetical protein TRSC58_06251 [Trypanosoma rangeli SC58]
MVTGACGASRPNGAVQALKRLLRATGVSPGNAFVPAPCRGGGTSGSAWCNDAVSARDTVATCELVTREDYFGPRSLALLCLRVRPACPGRAFPTSCIVSISTSSQRLDALALQDVVVKEWPLHSAGAETTVAVSTLYHVATLLGAEPVAGTRVFMTLRFLGCCDASNTHRIAALELFYTPHDTRTVAVELTLSPTPRPAAVAVHHNASSSDEEVAPPPPPPPLRRVRSLHSSLSRASTDADSRAGGGGATPAGSEDDALAKYVFHARPRSPRRRSVTQPLRTIYVDINTEEDEEEKEEELIADDVIEVPTSPCTTLSTSSRLPARLTVAGRRGPSADTPVVSASRVSTASGRTLCRNAGAVPRQEAPASPQFTTSDGGVSAALRGGDPHQPALREARCSSVVVTASAAPPRCAAFVVPDRRDFVAVSLLQQRQKEEEERQQQRRYMQRVSSMPWEEACAPPAFPHHGVENEAAAAVAQNKRRIRNLQGVPAYEAEHDLLRAVMELLGLPRETLYRGAPSRRISTAPSRLCSVQSGACSRQPCPSPRQSEEAVEPAPPATDALAVDASQAPQRSELKPATPPPLHVDLAKSFVLLLEPPVGHVGAESHTPLRALADRTAELNLLREATKTAAKIEPSREAQQLALRTGHIFHGTSLPSSEESYEPSLLLQMEPPASHRSPPCWGGSISLGTLADAAEPATTSLHIGTFLVWKHHFSRNGVAKRILLVQREGEVVLLTLKKLDRQKKAPQLALRKDVAVATGLQAYYSNAIHRDHVHIAECCLVVTRSGQQVAAVEMQSVGELQLAVQLLLPACTSKTRVTS